MSQQSVPSARTVRANPTEPTASVTSVTVILFCVSVPVLSEQITVALPSDSTAGNLLTIAFLRDMRSTPIASIMVTMAGSPSGIAATARLTDVINITNNSIWRITPITKMIPQIINAPMPSNLPVCDSFLCNDV
jgi:ABC-type multidrug transport system fused ATPase/permease subunit